MVVESCVLGPALPVTFTTMLSPGDIYNQAAVNEVVAKADVVIETLGVPNNRKSSLKEVLASSQAAARARM